MVKKGVKLQAENNNPTGIGGFGDHPEHRCNTGIEKDLWWRNLFIELAQEKKGEKERRRLVAEGLWDKAETGDVSAFNAIADRMEGKPQQLVDHTSGGDKIDGILVKWG